MTPTPIDRMYAALSAGDVDAVKACFVADARVWHSFDRIEQDLESAAASWAGLIAHSQARGLTGIRCRRTDDGLVQQHVFWLQLPSGERKAWPVCLVVTLAGDRIARIDEYIDRAGSFTPDA